MLEKMLRVERLFKRAPKLKGWRIEDVLKEKGKECMWEKDFVKPVKMVLPKLFTMLSSLKNPFEVVSIER